MRKSWVAAIALATLTLQANSLAQARGTDDLASLQLFGPDAQARFDLDLACTAETATSGVQCATVRAAFERWADARKIVLRTVPKDEPEFDGKLPAPNPATPKPYHLAVLFEPVLVPAVHNWSGSFNTMPYSYTQGSTGYRATVFVYDVATGALSSKLSLHERRQIPDHANVTPVMKSEIQDVIAKIDQGYSP